ncbi:MAG: (Fe-S)-binding protein, partial [Nitrospirae bacterium]|nr:(Fe-S)-binding protein [Nitrospirota bacterium]
MSKAGKTPASALLQGGQIEDCVRCGRCKALCPTYIEDPVEGLSARGRVALLKKYKEGRLKPSKMLDERLSSCLLCGACNSMCPAEVNVTNAIYEIRKDLKNFSNHKRFFGLALKFLLKRPESGFKMLKLLNNIGEMLPLQGIQPFKTMRGMGLSFPESKFRSGNYIFNVENPKGRIAVFGGCTVNFLLPSAG